MQLNLGLGSHFVVNEIGRPECLNEKPGVSAGLFCSLPNSIITNRAKLKWQLYSVWIVLVRSFGT